MSSKQARSGYWRTYYAANREKKKAAAKRWALENPERLTAYWKASYATNRAHDLAYSRAWQRSHLEQIRAWAKAHRLKHGDRIRERERRYRAAHRERVLALGKAWNARNPEKHREIIAQHNMKRRGAPGSHTPQEWRDKVALFGGCCAFCGEARPLEREHDVPVSRGGSNEIGNILPACRSCNAQKHQRTAPEFMEHRATLARAWQ